MSCGTQLCEDTYGTPFTSLDVNASLTSPGTTLSVGKCPLLPSLDILTDEERLLLSPDVGSSVDPDASLTTTNTEEVVMISGKSAAGMDTTCDLVKLQ